MLRSLQIVLLAGLLLAAGCAPPELTVGGQPRKKLYKNVVSLSPSTTEILLLFCNYRGIVKGRTAADNYPEQSVGRIPVVASVKPDLEKLKSIGTDLIVYDESLYNEADVQKFKSLGIDTFALGGATVEEFADELHKLGVLIGGETNLSEYVDKIHRSIALAEGEPLQPKPKVAVLLPGAGGGHYIAGAKSFQADVVRVAGGDPVGPEADRFVPANPEQLVSMNPDILVIPVSKKAVEAERSVNAVLQDPKLKSLAAVTGRRFVPIDQDIILRRGARVERLIEGLHKGLLAARG